MSHVIFWSVILFWVIGDIYFVFLFKRPERDYMESESKFTMSSFIIFGIIVGTNVNPKFYSNWSQPFNLWRYLGIAIILTGAFITYKSKNQLWKHNALSNVLLTDGMFRHIRHPQYLGLLISFSGIALCLFSPFTSFFFLAFSMLGILVRVEYREQKLIKDFKELYLDYSRRSYKLIPFIY
ncbi:MAG: isoprenylcysteine carboxylmethyltransferase family protein [Kosmotoga sp.]|nr:MAG: isoprenylcysteine carboxylmethyltransferase family protein [Kosmotoga sp.]